MKCLFMICFTGKGGRALITDDEMRALERPVRKSNFLIQKSRFSLSLMQQKIMLFLISQISPLDEDFREYTFSIPEFCKITGIDISGGNYELLKTAILEIVRKRLWIEKENGEEVTVAWIDKATLKRGDGTIKIRLDEDMKPYLLQLKGNYTTIELIRTLHFKSKYTIRLYELVKSIHFHELEEYQREYSLEELRRLLDAEKYERWVHFRQRVLDPAVQEINEYSDKNVVWQPIKRGRSIERIRFTITAKDSLQVLQLRDRIASEMGYDEQLSLWSKSKE